MRGSIGSAISALALVAGAALAAETTKPDATATLMDAAGARKGSATFTDTASGIAIAVTGTALPAGTKGIHLHMTGTCEGPDFATAGGHWNPAGHKHGTENPAGAHLGDMKNIEIGTDGAGATTAVIPDAKVKSGANPLLDADGAALVIHAAADDYKSDPAGNSGKRIACGVIQPN